MTHIQTRIIYEERSHGVVKIKEARVLASSGNWSPWCTEYYRWAQELKARGKVV